eukprot:gene8297-9869_t
MHTNFYSPTLATLDAKELLHQQVVTSLPLRSAPDAQEGILQNYGKADVSVIGDWIQLDGQWVPEDGIAPTFMYEVVNAEGLTIAMAKANRVVMHSESCRYFMVVKIWRDVIPSQIAAALARWIRSGNTVQERELQATHFDSFGNRPATQAELDEFPHAPGNGLWVSSVVGVTNGDGRIDCTKLNQALPIFSVVPEPSRLFDVPSAITPPKFLALPPLMMDLFTMKWDLVEAVRDDIVSERWTMTEAQHVALVNDPDVPDSLRQFAQGKITR